MAEKKAATPKADTPAAPNVRQVPTGPAPAALTEEHLLPWERQGRAGAVSERLSDALEGVLDDEDEPDGADEPEDDADEPGDDPSPSEDDSDEEDEPEEDESDEEDPSPKAKGKKWKLKANGQEEEVDESELVRRAEAGTDYTRKTQAVAEERRELRAARENYVGRIEMIERALDEQHGEEPDWTELERTNPALYQSEWIRWSRVKDAKVKLAAEKNGELAKMAEEDQAAFAERAKVERDALFKAIPELGDEKRGLDYAKRMMTYAHTTYGFDENYIGAVSDHRFMLLLDKARKYDEMLAEGKSKVKGKLKDVPVLRPGGAKKTASASKEFSQRRKALSRSGSEKDALALVGMMDFDD